MFNYTKQQERAKYYERDLDYFKRHELYKLIKDKHTTDAKLINFIKTNKIDFTFYVPLIVKDTYVPIIYFLCQFNKYPETFKYITDRK